MILQILEQQQQIFAAHMSRSNKILTTFGKGNEPLRIATIKSAEAAEKQTEITQKAQEKKGPTNNKLPKFHAKANESFSDW